MTKREKTEKEVEDKRRKDGLWKSLAASLEKKEMVSKPAAPIQKEKQESKPFDWNSSFPRLAAFTSVAGPVATDAQARLGRNDKYSKEQDEIEQLLETLVLAESTAVEIALEELDEEGRSMRTDSPEHPRRLQLTRGGDIVVDGVERSEMTWEPTFNKDALSATFASKIPRKDRLFLLKPWTNGLAARKEDYSRKEEHKLARLKVLEAALQEDTIEAYAGNVLKFLIYCDENDVEMTHRFPSNPKLVQDFLLSMAGNFRRATIERYIGAIKFWHVIHEQSFELESQQWKKLKKGLDNLQPSALPPRPAAKMEDLQAIGQQLDLTKSEAVSLFAACTVALFGMCRAGEITCANLTSFDPSRNASGADVQFFETSREHPEHFVIKIPFDKVEGRNGREVYIFHQSTDPLLDPFEALRRHLLMNRPTSSEGLFSYWDYTGTRRRELTHSYFIKEPNTLLGKVGRGRLFGHS